MELITGILIVIGLVLIFTHESLTVNVAIKKGYSPFVAGFIGLIPVFGLVYYLRLQPKRNISPSTISNIFNIKNILLTSVIYFELVILAIVVLVPVIYMIGTALSPGRGIPYTIWPDNPTLENFKFLLTGSTIVNGKEIVTHFTQWYLNTLTIAVFTMVFSVLFVTGSAYVFARYKFKGKKAGLLGILVLQMFPSFMGLIAIYTLFETFGLLDQPNALVVIYTAGSIPFNIWLIKGYLQGIPRELDESARIDGANKLQIFFKIIMPLSVPIISFVAVTQFMAPWMDYILPSFVIRTEEKWTLAVGIFAFVNDPVKEHYPAFAASALIIAIPIATLYIVFQKYLIEGLTAGANKG